MRAVAIFRFSPTEGPGYFGPWLGAREIPYRIIGLDQGEAVPDDARAFAGIGMMGGPMSVNDDLPWRPRLLELLRGAVAADVPVIGHCLGGQMLAKSLGAEVTRTATPEIGWGEVTVSDADAARTWFGGRERFTTFQWHYDVFSLPPGATRVLTNGFNGEQAYVLGKHIGFQSHIEMTREMVETWCRTGASELPVRSAAPLQSDADIRTDVDRRLGSLSAVADDVYEHWSQGLAR